MVAKGPSELTGPHRLPVVDGQGRLAHCLRIGVTGHRDLADPDEVGRQVAAALAAIEQVCQAGDRGRFHSRRGTTPIRLQVVSALAEGADRTVAATVLDAGGELLVLLPYDEATYVRTDCSSPASVAEYTDLRGRASQAWTVDGTPLSDDADRPRRYEELGLALVESIDVLIAVWDGQDARGRGGTSSVVSAARTARVPVIWVPARRQSADDDASMDPPAVTSRWGARAEDGVLPVDRLVAWPAARTARWFHDHLANACIQSDVVTSHVALDEYNCWRVPVPDATSSTVLGWLGSGVAAQVSDLPRSRQAAGSVDAWLHLAFERADRLAIRFQRRYFAADASAYGLAAVAVTLGALSSVLLPYPWARAFLWAEAAVLGVLVTTSLLDVRQRLHDRWVHYRALAEELRACAFLWFVDRPDGSSGGRPRFTLRRRGPRWVPWFARTVDTLWEQRPDVSISAEDIVWLRDVVAEGWIGDQRRYHERTRDRHLRSERRLSGVVRVMIVVTFAVAVAHAVLAYTAHAHGAEVAMGFLAITLPGFAAAVTGVAAQREHHRHGQRFARMAHHLATLEHQAHQADTLVLLRQQAEAAWHTVTTESTDWYESMRLHRSESVS